MGNTRIALLILGMTSFVLCSCSNNIHLSDDLPSYSSTFYPSQYTARLPQHMMDPQGERVVVVDPNVHAWGAYDPSGNLVRAGLASAGANWCPDLGRPCHTVPGTFRVQYLGSSSCVSSIFPIPRGGAPMPYCMYFDENQALHGSYELAEGNISHGCVRMHVSDAEWLRFHFVTMGTKVIVKPY